MEEQNHRSRGFKRYDPHSRRYVEWHIPHDWDHIYTDIYDNQGYPRFTREEVRKMDKRRKVGKPVNAMKMGKDWNWNGPNVSLPCEFYAQCSICIQRFRQEHDAFWQSAHRIGENYRETGMPYGPRNPFFRLAQQWPDDVYLWQNWDL